jgi:hypothetical protein
VIDNARKVNSTMAGAFEGLVDASACLPSGVAAPAAFAAPAQAEDPYISAVAKPGL